MRVRGKAIRLESLWASGNAQSTGYTNTLRLLLFSTLRKHFFPSQTAQTVSTSLFHFYYNRLHAIWNIITFILVMVVWIPFRDFWCLCQSREKPLTMTFSYAFVLRCTFLRDTFVQREAKKRKKKKLSTVPRTERMMDVLNYLMKIMIM